MTTDQITLTMLSVIVLLMNVSVAFLAVTVRRNIEQIQALQKTVILLMTSEPEKQVINNYNATQELDAEQLAKQMQAYFQQEQEWKYPQRYILNADAADLMAMIKGLPRTAFDQLADGLDKLDTDDFRKG